MNRIVFSFIDLYSRSVVELTADNAKSVKSLLLKYTQLFAALDADLGQTKVITHNIDTGTAYLDKQPYPCSNAGGDRSPC